MTEGLSYKNSEKGRGQFLQNLRDVSRHLSFWDVQYAVVGGMALRATLGKPVEYVRSNGTMVDFDAVALGPDPKTIQNALNDIKGWEKKKPFCPEVGLEPIQFGGRPTKHSKTQFLSGLRKDDQGNYFLTYRDIEEPIPPETMELIPRQYGGITLPTFPAKTILFRYLTRGGLLKPKDDQKLSELENWIIEHWSAEPDDRLYEPYLAFADKIRGQYPRSIALYDAFWTFDRFVGGKISGSGGYIYSLIDRFR